MSLSLPDCPSKLMGAGAVPSLPIGSGLHHHKPKTIRESSNCPLVTGSQSLILYHVREGCRETALEVMPVAWKPLWDWKAVTYF